jgi:hypothetical protein
MTSIGRVKSRKTVPEGVAVVLVVVDGGVQGQAVAVDRVAAVGLEEQLEGGAETGVGAVDRGVLSGLVALAADLGAGQVGLVPGVVDGAQRLVRGCFGLRRGGEAELGRDAAAAAEFAVADQGAAGGAGEDGVLAEGQPVEDVGWDDGTEHCAHAPHHRTE